MLIHDKAVTIVGQAYGCEWFKVVSNGNSPVNGWVRADEIVYTVKCSDVKAADIPPTPTVTPTITPTYTPTSTFTPTSTSTPTSTFTPSSTPTPIIPAYYPGLAPTLEQIPDAGSMDALINLAKYFASQPSVVSATHFAFFGPMEQPDVSEVLISCNNIDQPVCAILATARVENRLYLITQISTKTGPKNLLLYMGSPYQQYEADAGRAVLGMLNGNVAGYFKYAFYIVVATRIKINDYDNQQALKLVVGRSDPMPDRFQRLGNGEIVPELEITPVWATVV